MKPQFIFRCPYVVTQGYADNAGNRYNGPLDGHHHGALDIVPIQNGAAWPAPIYPMFPGSEISIADTDPVKGKGVRERVTVDQPFIQYCQSKGVLPANPNGNGNVVLEILYWHMLDITDQTGTLDDNTPIGHAGNTGDVFTNGVAVPDNEKGIPPYPGLHTHLETSLKTDRGVVFNLDKDPQGRIDPNIIINYQGDTMPQIKSVNIKGEEGIFLAAASPEEFQALCNVFGKDPANVDETV